jgi:hypothetical protein
MHLFGTRLETIPAKVPYLAADSPTVAAFRERIGAAPGLKVGLAWAGNPDHWNDRNRSLELATLAPLFEVEGALFFSLQKGPRAVEIEEAGLTDRIIDLSPALGDFADTAAALSCLDLVISVDTAVAHLAGALGKPVWTLLAYAPDWRWLMDRADSPWYPTMRLYRQPALGNWRAAIEQAAKDLRRVASSHHAEAHAVGLEGLAKYAAPARLASTGPHVVGLDARPQVGADELADRFNKRLAIIVPFRNRAQHLTAFIPHMLTYFQRAESECALPISIHVVEQHGNAPFNRGKINNAGYMLVRELADYVCFHDVDYLPISADYSWSRRPARLAWHGLRLREDWDNFFGAVVLFDKPAFEQVNGFPNEYWGWGPEDEELGMRCKLTGLGFDRRDGTYRGLPHRHAGFSAPGVLTEEARRTRALYAVRRRNLLAVMADDGLSSLQFEPLRCTPLRLDAMDPANCFHHLVDIGGPDAVD